MTDRKLYDNSNAISDSGLTLLHPAINSSNSPIAIAFHLQMRAIALHQNNFTLQLLECRYSKKFSQSLPHYSSPISIAYSSIGLHQNKPILQLLPLVVSPTSLVIALFWQSINAAWVEPPAHYKRL